MTTFDFLKQVFKQAPFKIILLVIFIILAGVLEGVGFTLFIPLIRIITASAGDVTGVPKSDIFYSIFHSLGISNSLFLILGIIVSVTAAKNIFLYFQKIFSSRISIEFEVNLKKRIFDAVFASEWQFYLNQKVGTLINAMGLASNKAATAFKLETQLCAEILNVTLYCVVGLLISWQAFLTSMFAGFLYVYFSRNFIHISRGIGKEGVDVDNSSQTAVLEDFTGIKFIKGNALEQFRKDKLFSLIDKYGKVSFRRDKYAAILETLPEFFMAVIMCGIFYVSYTFFHVPGENLLVLLMILYRFNRRTMDLQTIRQRLLHYLPSYELCASIIDKAERAKEITGERVFERLKESIEFKDVDFSYTGQPVLVSVSFEIKKNQFVAFVGKSGSGKTTVLDLVIGLLKPQKGMVAIDGRNMEEYDMFSWRKKIGYVPQEAFLINGTVEDNIRLSNPEASMEDIISAAKMAHAHEFIQELLEKYDTVVGDRGIKLSGGQCQRIVLARALVSNPELLILDEATSALDNRSESIIQMAINELKGKLTILVVAHRLTTIQKADVIHVLHDSNIVDSGTMQSLRGGSRVFKEVYLGD